MHTERKLKWCRCPHISRWTDLYRFLFYFGRSKTSSSGYYCFDCARNSRNVSRFQCKSTRTACFEAIFLFGMHKLVCPCTGYKLTRNPLARAVRFCCINALRHLRLMSSCCHAARTISFKVSYCSCRRQSAEVSQRRLELKHSRVSIKKGSIRGKNGKRFLAACRWTCLKKILENSCAREVIVQKRFPFFPQILPF